MVKVRMDIETLVTWALRDQGLGWSRDSLSGLAQMMALGTMVDTSATVRAPSVALLTSDDALHVQDAINALPAEARALVWRYGRTALRPEWGEEGAGNWDQEIGADGRPRWIWEDPINRTGRREPKLVFVGTDPEVIAAERAEWTLWREALLAMVGPLNAVLLEHEATGPAAPARPWDDAPPTILGAVPRPPLRPAPMVRETTAAEARARANVPNARASDWSYPQRVADEVKTAP